MTIYVPTRVSTILLETPVAGGIDEIDAASRFVDAAARDTVQFSASLRTAENELFGAHSVAVTKVASKLHEQLSPGATTLHTAATGARQAFNTYAGEVHRIHTAAARLKQEVADALASLRSHVTTIEDIASLIRVPTPYEWRSGAPLQMPDPQPGLAADASPSEQAHQLQSLRGWHENNWRAAAFRWRECIDEIDAAATSWSELIQNRRAAERRLVGALGDTAIGQLITLADGSGASHTTAITTAVAGELWGVTVDQPAPSKSHPLLQKLIGAESGAATWDSPPDPVQVAASWDALSKQEQDTLITETPWVIGNLPGLPFAVRDRANRILLEHYVTHQQSLGTDCQAALTEIMRVLDRDTGKPPIHMVAIDLDGEVPLTAVGYGGLDTAQNLSWQVPGMFNDVQQGLPGWNVASRNLYDEEVERLITIGRDDEGVALISFFEYDTPDLVTVLSSETARSAAPRLAAELDGTFVTRDAHTLLPNRTVLAHSYGTPVAANALLLTKYPMQSFTMVASAGLDGDRVSSLSDLHVEHDASGRPKIYTTIASKDTLAPVGSNVSGRLQPNPDAAWLDELRIDGAYSFSSDGDGDLLPTTGHSIVQDDKQGYLDAKTESLHNVAGLLISRPEQVNGGFTTVQDSHAPAAGARR